MQTIVKTTGKPGLICLKIALADTEKLRKIIFHFLFYRASKNREHRFFGYSGSNCDALSLPKCATHSGQNVPA
jgi:hypothetical protein